MQIVLTTAGSYPRIGDAPELQRHRQAYAKRERGEMSKEAFGTVEDETTAEVIREQIEAGIELVTDGQVRWYDPYSHLARPLEGVEINGLLRLFDTNFYFRQPVVKGPIRRKRPILLPEYEFARSVSSRPVKPVLTGPYTLARGSILGAGYGSIHALALAYAEALALEVGDLARAGATLIQVDEPAILRHPEDLNVLEEALAPLARERGKARLALHASFGDVTPLYGDLQALPVDILGLDFTYSPKLPALIADAGSSKPLALGIIDARNTKLETAEGVFAILDTVLPALGPGPAYLTPSCGLEFLPRERARQKLETMKRLRDAYLGGRS
jgi:5-methyltetrahydropteroyltriglutamate--homocysteine methyltransferase